MFEELGIVLPLLSGWIFLSFTHKTRYKFSQFSGYQLFFAALAVGFLNLLIFRTFRMACLNKIADLHFTEDFKQSLIHFFNYPALSVDGLGSILIAAFAVYIFNGAVEKEEALSNSRDEDPLSSLLDAAQNQQRSVMITLDNKKVYIGIIIALDDNPSMGRSVSLLPIYSGYRHNWTLDYMEKNSYAKIVDVLLIPPNEQITDNHLQRIGLNRDQANRIRQKGIDAFLVSVNYDRIVSVMNWANLEAMAGGAIQTQYQLNHNDC